MANETLYAIRLKDGKHGAVWEDQLFGSRKEAQKFLDLARFTKPRKYFWAEVRSITIMERPE